MKTQVYEVLRSLRSILSEGRSAYLITVLETWGASPRPTGSLLCFDPERNKVHGSVSGGCIEMELLEGLSSNPDVHTYPMVRSYGSGSDGVELPCGANLSLLVEFLSPDSNARQRDLNALRQIDSLLEKLDQGAACKRRVYLSGEAPQLISLVADENCPKILREREQVTQFFDAPRRLLVIGAGDVAESLIPLAQQIGYRVTLCEPRPKVVQQLSHTSADELITDRLPDDIVFKRFMSRSCAVLALAHDPRVDDLAIVAALEGESHFVGALGSQRTTLHRKQRLAVLGLQEHQLHRLKAPVGLDIGSKTPIEIAISIAAELIKVQRFEANAFNEINHFNCSEIIC